MGPDAAPLDWTEAIRAMNEFTAAIEKLAAAAENNCGDVRESHDVAYCIHCEGGFCRRCGRADNWGAICLHEPAWRHDL